MSNMSNISKRTGVGELAAFLGSKKSEIASVLPAGMNPDRVIKTAVMAALSNNNLGKCSTVSVYRSIMQAAILGVMPGDGTREAYLIPYGQDCTMQLSYIGMAKVACTTDGVDVVRASIVYSRDSIDMCEHPPSLTHRKHLGGGRGDLLGSVAAAYRIRPGGHDLIDFAFVTADELAQARKLADAGRASPAWRDWWSEMAKKVAVKRLCKLLPKSPLMAYAQGIEANHDAGVPHMPDPFALPETDSIETIIEAELVPSGPDDETPSEEDAMAWSAYQAAVDAAEDMDALGKVVSGANALAPRYTVRAAEIYQTKTASLRAI